VLLILLEAAMRKRWTFGILIVIVALLVLAWMFPTTIYVPVGFVKGEATFDGKPTDYWVHALKQEPYLGHEPPPGDAGKTLREGGSGAVPVLCEIAQSREDSLRISALTALALMGPEAKAAKPVLVAGLKTEKNRNCFLIASQALGNIDPSAAAEALSAVLREERNGDYIRQACAFAALLKLAPQGQEALPTLKEIFNDPKQDPLLLVQAIDVLWHMGQPAEPLVAKLCEMLAVDNSPVGVQALEVLQGMGPSAKSALPILLKVLDRPNLPLSGPRGGSPHRIAIIRTLGAIGPDARAAVPALFASLQSNNFLVRAEVAMALARMGSVGKNAVALRDAVSAATITLLAACCPGNIAIPGFVRIEKTTWIPQDLQSFVKIRVAVEKIDPGAAKRAGLPPLPRDLD
jgi:HEAT repeat protein